MTTEETINQKMIELVEALKDMMIPTVSPAPTEETIYITLDPDCISRKYGTDSDGCEWIEYDYEGGCDEPDNCTICGAELWDGGWTNLDDGSEAVCSHHIEFV